MNEQKFISLRPYLYHLTDERNIENIIRSRSLLSTQRIVESSNIEDKANFLRNKRQDHEVVSLDGLEYRIRDQRPISLLALSKCLTNNWETGDFIGHLNIRVFFWCTIDRLSRHFTRYEQENPTIIRCQTADVLELNGERVEYCRINSGATRPNSYLGGIAPYRGPDTFLRSDLSPLTPGTVAEVTVLDCCVLPEVCFSSKSPEGPWERLEFT